MPSRPARQLRFRCFSETTRARPLLSSHPGLPQPLTAFGPQLLCLACKARTERGFPGRDTEPLPGARESRAAELASPPARHKAPLCAPPAPHGELGTARAPAAPAARGSRTSGSPPAGSAAGTAAPALLRTRQRAKPPLLKIGCARPRSSERRGRAASEHRGGSGAAGWPRRRRYRAERPDQPAPRPRRPRHAVPAP